MIATGVIEYKREIWIKKRIVLIERIISLRDQGYNDEADKLESVLDIVQEAISDLSEMIDSLNNISSYEESCLNLINKTNNKQ
jgi:prefoldin subunit 5